MTDREFILFLAKLLMDDLIDGDTPTSEDFFTIEREFKTRGLSMEDIGYYEYETNG